MRLVFGVLVLMLAGCAGSSVDEGPDDTSGDGLGPGEGTTSAPASGAPTTTSPPGEPPADPPSNGTRPLDGEPDDCERLIPGTGTFADPQGSASEKTLVVAFAVDETFLAAYGDNWTVRADEIVKGLDELFTRELSLRVRAAHVAPLPPGTLPEFHPDAELLEAADEANAIMTALQAHYNATYPDLGRHAVHLLLGGDAAGDIGGKAHCIGGVGYRDAAYSWSEAEPEDAQALGPVAFFDSMALKVAAHELSHVMGAHHHYANCVEGATGHSTGDVLAACTLMYNDSGLIGQRISTANKLAIRAVLEANQV
jgi:hypothetical protein